MGKEYSISVIEKNLRRLIGTSLQDGLEERFYGEDFVHAREDSDLESKKIGYSVSQGFPSDKEIIDREIPPRDQVYSLILVDEIYKKNEELRRRIRRWENEAVKGFFRKNLERALEREWADIPLEETYEWVTTRRLIEEYPKLRRSFNKCEEGCHKAIENKKRYGRRKREIEQIREMFNEVIGRVPEGMGRAAIYASLARSLKKAFYDLGKMSYWYEAMINAQRAAELDKDSFRDLPKEIEIFDEERAKKNR